MKSTSVNQFLTKIGEFNFVTPTFVFMFLLTIICWRVLLLLFKGKK